MTFTNYSFNSLVPDCVGQYYQRELSTKLIYQTKSCVLALWSITHVITILILNRIPHHKIEF